MGENDVVMITGASSGIGREVAHQLARRGTHLVLVARGAAGLEKVAAECLEAGAGSADVVPCDVGDHQQVEEAVRQVMQQHGRLDGVVNAAGVFAAGRATTIPVDVFDAVIRTNLLGSANVARATLPVLAARDSGTLVLFGSLLGHVTAPFIAPYVVSKWGVRGLARVLEAEVRDADVRVEYVAPAGVDTAIYRRAANYLGRALQAPPPLTPPETVAADVVALLDGRRPGRFTAPLPRLFHVAARVGFSLLPAAAFDAIAALALNKIAVDHSEAHEPDPGAVLEPGNSAS